VISTPTFNKKKNRRQTPTKRSKGQCSLSIDRDLKHCPRGSSGGFSSSSRGFKTTGSSVFLRRSVSTSRGFKTHFFSHKLNTDVPLLNGDLKRQVPEVPQEDSRVPLEDLKRLCL